MKETIIERLRPREHTSGNQTIPWPPGPWDSEPDRVEWVDDETGYTCIARRGQTGSWCGYAGVPQGHPFFGKGYSDMPSSVHQVHGGLTYASECGGTPGRDVCHVSSDGEEVWWFGFDCAHAWDYGPLNAVMHAMRGDETDIWAPHGDEVYRDLEYVKGECKSLALRLFLHRETV